MKIGSTFSGIGAFDLGFQMEGYEIAWQVEINEKARSVLERHWPSVKKYHDIKTVTNVDPVDVLIGGFPCQDLSVAGRRKGLAGERSGLWFQFHRVLGELRPQWVVIENVPGLLSSHGGRDFAIVLRGLVELGYGVSWRVLDAQYYGVAQRRRRVFIVGSLGNGRAAQVLFEPESLSWDLAPSREAGQEAPRVSGTLASSGGGTERPAGNANELDFCIPVAKPLAYSTTNDHYDHTQQDYIPVMGTLTGRTGRLGTDEADQLLAFGGNKTSGPQDVAPSLLAHGGTGRHDFASEIFIAFQQNQRDEVRDLGDVAGALASQPGAKQQNYIAFSRLDSGQDASDELAPTMRVGTTPDGHAGTPGNLAIAFSVGPSESSFGIGASEEVSPPILAASGGNQIPAVAMMGVRRLTPTECERLQGLPDGWTAGQKDGPRYAQIGNAVAVPVIRWIARRIRDVQSNAQDKGSRQ